MAEPRFEATVRHLPGVAVLALHGEIDAGAEAALTAAYDEASGRDPAAILFDFGAVDYINSVGIALLVGLLARARVTGCRLLACRLSEHYVEIFMMTRLADFMAIFPDEASALATAGRAEESDEARRDRG
jgi:anti-anti-sigma factor